ncbi:hypothetical protein D3C76_1331760 [compost metagenome]
MGLKGPWTGNALAFLREDGAKVVIVANPFAERRTLRLSDGADTIVLELEPESFHTIVI